MSYLRYGVMTVHLKQPWLMIIPKDIGFVKILVAVHFVKEILHAQLVVHASYVSFQPVLFLHIHHKIKPKDQLYDNKLVFYYSGKLW